MISLTVVVITYNEEHNIGRCLDSVMGLADEIVVVDSFSTDQTIRLAKERGAKVFQNTFEGHIQQKNYALSKASHDYVLSLDADEALHENLKAEIISCKSNFNCDGYYLHRLTNYCGHWVRHCGWYPDNKLRLFDKRKGHWAGMNPHDKFTLFEGDRNTRILNGDILHYSYYTVDEHIKQMHYFSTIAAGEMFRQGKKPYGIQLIINPALHFFKSYLIKLGFLDGWRGLQICSISSYGTFLKYYRLLLLINKSQESKVNS